MKSRLHLSGGKITLGFLTFCLSFGFVNQVQSQQFVNGKLVRKEKFPGGDGDTYLKYGADYKKLYTQANMASDLYQEGYFRQYYIDGLDTLRHNSCKGFALIQNCSKYGVISTADSSVSAEILVNGDTFSDFGFSLKINAPLLKDSNYNLSFLVASIEAYRIPFKFFNKKLNPYEDFKIYITQSNSPNSEGDIIAIIRRQDVYELDSSTYFPYTSTIYPRNSLPCTTMETFYYRVKKEIKGANSGQYITIRAKTQITDSVSRLFRYNCKPSVLFWKNQNLLERGFLSTDYQIQCPFTLIKTGDLCNQKNPLVINKSSSATTSTVTVNKCKDSLLTIGLQSSPNQNNYQWNSGSKNQRLSVSIPGCYIRNSQWHGCSIVDTFMVQNHPKHKAIDKINYTLCMGDSIVLTGLTNKLAWYRKNLFLSNVSVLQIHGVQDDTLVLKSIDNCEQLDTIVIKVENCYFYDTGFLYIPNAFTPNKDGKNDVFIIPGKSIHNYEMTIYNRWGEQVFFTTNAAEGWDGTYRNIDAPAGPYVVVLKNKSNSNSGSQNNSQDLNLPIQLLR
ncbi:MAG: gliding motility-associated C-terminal domain-containing protein [Bacteroidetes bacterium]|nr:gliding motility-associated C-terminal domain-containing protein [Bacteroidota bacterium]